MSRSPTAGSTASRGSPASGTSARASRSRRCSATLVMFVECLRMVRRTRYDLIHAVEESAFIAAAAEAVSGIPYIYDMDSSLAEQMVEAYPRLQFAAAVPALLRVGGRAPEPRRADGVRGARGRGAGPRPGQAGRPGRGQHAAARRSRRARPTATGRFPRRSGAPGRSRCTSAIWSATRASTCCSRGSGHTLRTVPSASLVIVGGREDDIRRYRRIAASLGILPRVHFLGPRPVSALARLCCGRPMCWCRPASRDSTRR